ncbi:ROK family protein [Planobispora takensis]|uniref:Sugar kinase n=1 Tax=Planobispora takensis TaxID=1367882 RepID=A0A8J3SX67_9ACTN|nr:ROK family protein [Planobispora takensis]GIH99969.1 sugar kinase [Planobispora takensis]
MTLLALDIGGTKFAAAHLDADGTLLRRAERPIGPSPSGTLAALVADFHDPGLTAIGIGTAGPVDVRAETVSPVNIPQWRDFPLAGAVRRLVPGVEVVLAGDGQCMALGEWWRGGHGVDSLLGIVVSTGVGGGLILGGRPVLGGTGNAGHIGHVIVDRDGEPCPCGARGCLETLASGPAMVRWALANGWTPAGDLAVTADNAAVQGPVTARGPVTAKDLADAARAGDAIPLAAFERAADALAVAVLNTAAVVDLHDVVIGGGVAAAGGLLIDPLREHLAKHAGMDFLRHITVSPTALSRDAGLYGAAALALLATGVTPRPTARGPAPDPS